MGFMNQEWQNYYREQPTNPEPLVERYAVFALDHVKGHTDWITTFETLDAARDAYQRMEYFASIRDSEWKPFRTDHLRGIGYAEYKQWFWDTFGLPESAFYKLSDGRWYPVSPSYVAKIWV